MIQDIYYIEEKYQLARNEIEFVTNTQGIDWLNAFQRLNSLEIPIDWGWVWKWQSGNPQGNCVSQALRLPSAHHDRIAKLKLKYEDSRLFASTIFVKYLIDKSIIEPINKPTDDAWFELTVNGRSDCLVLCYCEDKITHIGRYDIIEKKVISQWGSWPAILTHNLEQVPSSYGNEIKFFADKNIDFEKLFDEFIIENTSQFAF